MHGACNKEGSPPPAKDYVQEGYSVLWGESGRDDLGTLKRLGANAVRVDAALGLESKHDHGAFLDRAEALGVHVMPGFYTQMLCPKFDCFDAWKKATAAGLAEGYKAKSGSDWHPAVSVLVLQDAPDNLNFGGGCSLDNCTGDGGEEAQCRVKAVLSAMDGVLMAEKEAKVKGTVKLTAAWSPAIKDSVDGKIKQQSGVFGFQDMVAGVANPKKWAKYSLRSSPEEFQKAFADRWTHSLNTESPWSFVKEKVGDPYEQYGFPPKKWFVAEFRASTMSPKQLTQDLKSMVEEASKEGSHFIGANLYEFQNDYTDQNPQKFGLFGLGDAKLGQTTDVCQEDVTSPTQPPTCNKWPAYCLQAHTDKGKERAPAVAAAWPNASLDALHGQCAELLPEASINEIDNSTDQETRPDSHERSGVRVVV